MGAFQEKFFHIIAGHCDGVKELRHGGVCRKVNVCINQWLVMPPAFRRPRIAARPRRERRAERFVTEV